MLPLGALFLALAVPRASASPLDLASLTSVGDLSIKNCGLESECDTGLQLKISSLPGLASDGKELPTSDWDSLGLNRDNLHVNSIAVGFAPAFQSQEGGNSPGEINEKLPKPMAVVGDYWTLNSWTMDMKHLDWHLDIIKKLEGNPVWCIAMRPSEGLDFITYDVADKIATKLKWINDQGITVWFRPMAEMNGNWDPWGAKPEEFIIKWRILFKAVTAKAKNTYVVWSPNVRFGDSVNDRRGGYAPYYPGSQYVHIVGISLYHWGTGAQRVNKDPTPDEAINKLSEFAKIYGPGGEGKPVVLCETAASYTYDRDTRAPVGHDASEYHIKMTWLHLLLDRYIKSSVPGFRAMIWFEVVKDENATGNTAVRTEDFRLILGSSKVASAARTYFQNVHQ